LFKLTQLLIYTDRVKITKTYIVLSFIFILSAANQLLAQQAMPSETLDGRKGVFRLISADINDEGAYFFRTSMEYFQDTSLLDDQRNSTGSKGTFAFGYALFPELLLTGNGGFRVSSIETGNFKQNYIVNSFQLGATGTYDLGARMFNEERRLMAGLSLMIDFSRPERFAKGIGVQPRFMVTTDYSDLQPVGVRWHLNAGINPAKDKRYFNPAKTITVGAQTEPFYKAFDYFAYQAHRKMSLPVATGVELPFWVVTPSVEAHWDYVFGAKFRDQPKWVTVGLKTRPFPQKNIEIFGAADIGLSNMKAVPDTERPDTHPVPMWNAIIGFGISKFGKRPNEVEIDSGELEETRLNLKERNEMLSALKADLAYNTVTGRVLDAETKMAMPGVTVSFPEQAQIRKTVTNDKGEFARYFPNLAGSRIVFSKEGYADSTKFLALKPGEAVRVDIQLARGGSDKIGDLKLSVTDESGKALPDAEIFLINQDTKAESKAMTDASGNVGIQLPQGLYSVEVRIEGYVVRKDTIEIRAGSAVIRSYALSSL
jgi:hypothetical protein